MKSLSGKKILITAGPTREYIDPVRYISNDSSGQMGLALAETAAKLKASATLIHGPITRVPRKGVRRLKGGHAEKIRRISIISARDMFTTVKKYYKQADIIIMAAAVADWRPVKVSASKIKKNSKTYNLRLIKNPDILKWLGLHKRPGQTLIGFALETGSLITNARKKLREKKCDVIIANHANVIGKKKGSAVIITSDGVEKKIINKTKTALARAIYKFMIANF